MNIWLAHKVYSYYIRYNFLPRGPYDEQKGFLIEKMEYFFI